MENTDNKNLSFGQRNWFLLCILVAIISPIVVHYLQIGARRESYKQSVDIRTSDSSKNNDTSNKVAVPPSTNPTPNKSKDSTTP